MTMEDFYEEMKAALRFFGLSFHEMAKISVSVCEDGAVQFMHGGRTIGITLPDA